MKMFPVVILFTMIFIHIMLDFHQGETIANMKCKDWWLNHPEYKPSYRFDYVIVLIFHGLSWAFALQIPALIYVHLNPLGYGTITKNLLISILTHGLVHAYVDHLKANKKVINLIADQLIHIAQIILMWLIFDQYYSQIEKFIINATAITL